jgi:hypothetical protein
VLSSGGADECGRSGRGEVGPPRRTSLVLSWKDGKTVTSAVSATWDHRWLLPRRLRVSTRVYKSRDRSSEVGNVRTVRCVCSV